MHQAAFDWVAAHAPLYAAHVVEVGSRNVNGTVRPVFAFCDSYIGVDRVPGDDVDVVADFCHWQPPAPAECVVCCEVLEHAEDWAGIVRHIASVLDDNGTAIITAACDPRPAHSGQDGALLRPGEHYANVDPVELVELLEDLFTDVEVDVADGDVRAVAHGPIRGTE